jgi:Domain of unknown function (DUF4129)
MTLVRLASSPPDAPPLDPTTQHAHQQLFEELAKTQYQAARPSALDLANQRFTAWINQLLNWFDSLFGKANAGDSTTIVLVVIAVVLVVALVIGLLVFGIPRLNRRSSANGVLFGEDDNRDSTTLRRAAEAAAARADFTTAIEEEFRSIARALAERAVVTTFPGTTAHGFAVSASAAFPSVASQLSAAANSFDSVRYLGHTGTQQEWGHLRDLELTLRSTRPQLHAAELHGAHA